MFLQDNDAAELYDELEACETYDAMACRIDGYGVLLEGGAA